MKKLILILIASIYILPVTAQDSLTLEQAVKTALLNNYSIKIAQNEYAIAENNVTLGNAGFLPVVDLAASQNNAVVNGEQIRGAAVEEIDNRKNKSTVIGGEVNWTVFDGTRMFVNYDRLKELRLLSEAELQFAMETMIYNLTTTYFLAALEEERFRSFKNNLILSEDRLQIANDKYELGSGSKLEYLQAQVDYNSDKSIILSQQEVLAARKFELMQLMGLNDTIDFVIDYELKLNEQRSLDDLINRTEINNAQIESFRKTSEIADLEKRMLEAERMPTLNVFTGYNYSEIQRAVGFAFESNTTELVYGFTATMRLFNGFNLRRQIQNSQIAIENTQLQLENQKLEVITQLKSAYVRFQNNLQLIKLEEANLNVARENSDIAQERYRIGLSNALELREAQINLVNAEIRYQNAVFEAKLAEIELDYLTGTNVKPEGQ